MITLQLTVGGNGPTVLTFSSGTIAGVHLTPPGEGAGLGLLVSDLQETTINLSPVNGTEAVIRVDVNEGPNPVWLAFVVDCTSGGSVSLAFPGSPTARVNAGSYLGLEYNNGNEG